MSSAFADTRDQIIGGKLTPNTKCIQCGGRFVCGDLTDTIDIVLVSEKLTSSVKKLCAKKNLELNKRVSSSTDLTEEELRFKKFKEEVIKKIVLKKTYSHLEKLEQAQALPEFEGSVLYRLQEGMSYSELNYIVGKSEVMELENKNLVIPVISYDKYAMLHASPSNPGESKNEQQEENVRNILKDYYAMSIANILTAHPAHLLRDPSTGNVSYQSKLNTEIQKALQQKRFGGSGSALGGTGGGGTVPGSETKKDPLDERGPDDEGDKVEGDPDKEDRTKSNKWISPYKNGKLVGVTGKAGKSSGGAASLGASQTIKSYYKKPSDLCSGAPSSLQKQKWASDFGRLGGTSSLEKMIYGNKISNALSSASSGANCFQELDAIFSAILNTAPMRNSPIIADLKNYKADANQLRMFASLDSNKMGNTANTSPSSIGVSASSAVSTAPSFSATSSMGSSSGASDPNLSSSASLSAKAVVPAKPTKTSPFVGSSKPMMSPVENNFDIYKNMKKTGSKKSPDISNKAKKPKEEEVDDSELWNKSISDAPINAETCVELWNQEDGRKDLNAPKSEYGSRFCSAYKKNEAFSDPCLAIQSIKKNSKSNEEEYKQRMELLSSASQWLHSSCESKAKTKPSCKDFALQDIYQDCIQSYSFETKGVPLDLRNVSCDLDPEKCKEIIGQCYTKLKMQNRFPSSEDLLATKLFSNMGVSPDLLNSTTMSEQAGLSLKRLKNMLGHRNKILQHIYILQTRKTKASTREERSNKKSLESEFLNNKFEDENLNYNTFKDDFDFEWNRKLEFVLTLDRKAMKSDLDKQKADVLAILNKMDDKILSEYNRHMSNKRENKLTGVEDNLSISLNSSSVFDDPDLFETYQGKLSKNKAEKARQYFDEKHKTKNSSYQSILSIISKDKVIASLENKINNFFNITPSSAEQVVLNDKLCQPYVPQLIKNKSPEVTQ